MENQEAKKENLEGRAVVEKKESPVEKRQEMLSRVNSELSRPQIQGNVEQIRSQKEADIVAEIEEAEAVLSQSITEESRMQIMENNVEAPMRYVAASRERVAELGKQKDILEYVGRELPETEIRISEPMRPECKVAVSIPAYEEGSGILKSLGFLAKQEGVSPNEYEVIVNVNNRANANENTLKLNGQTLNILRFLGGESADVNFLSDEERERMQKIKESGLVVHYVDKSSEGREVTEEEDEKWKDEKTNRPAKCMQPRKRAMDEICERFVLAGKTDGIIASMDADTKVTSKWVRGIIDSFKDGNVQLVAGERRDGLDITENGELIGSDKVFEKMLDDWNDNERRNQEAFRELPDIKGGLQRAKILLMKNLINAYNTARSQFSRENEGKTGVVEDFKGGTGKMFRVGAYIHQPREIIKIMDGGGGIPAGLSEGSFNFIGREGSERAEPASRDAQIEALAVYPETRVRGWDLKQEDIPDNPYQDFESLYKPFGSSGKEYAYAIAAGLRGKIPTTYNEQAVVARRAIENFILGGHNEQSRRQLETLFDPEVISQIELATPQELEKLRHGDKRTIDKYKLAVDVMQEMGGPQTITDSLRFYGAENPDKETYNPERYFFGALVRQIARCEAEDKKEIMEIIKQNYALSDALIEKMTGFSSEQGLVDFLQNNEEIKSVFAKLPEKVNYKDAADLYEKLMDKRQHKVGDIVKVGGELVKITGFSASKDNPGRAFMVRELTGEEMLTYLKATEKPVGWGEYELNNLTMRLSSHQSKSEHNRMIGWTAREKGVTPERIFREVNQYKINMIREKEKGDIRHFHRTGMDAFKTIVEMGRLVSRSTLKKERPDIKILGWSASDNVMMTRDSFNADGKLISPGFSDNEVVGASSAGVIFVFSENIMDSKDYDAIGSYPTISNLPLEKYCETILVNSQEDKKEVERILAKRNLRIPVSLKSNWTR